MRCLISYHHVFHHYISASCGIDWSNVHWAARSQVHGRQQSRPQRQCRNEKAESAQTRAADVCRWLKGQVHAAAHAAGLAWGVAGRAADCTAAVDGKPVSSEACCPDRPKVVLGVRKDRHLQPGTAEQRWLQPCWLPGCGPERLLNTLVSSFSTLTVLQVLGKTWWTWSRTRLAQPDAVVQGWLLDNYLRNFLKISIGYTFPLTGGGGPGQGPASAAWCGGVRLAV